MELSKGQIKRAKKAAKKEADRKEYFERKTYIASHGYTIKEHVLGDRRYADSYSYQLYKDGVCVHPGSCYDYEEPLFLMAYKLIDESLKTKIETE